MVIRTSQDFELFWVVLVEEGNRYCHYSRVIERYVHRLTDFDCIEVVKLRILIWVLSLVENKVLVPL
jgi:hypothetical protein